jgi:hypothetical protein
MALRDPISGFWAQIEEARGNDSLTLPFPGGGVPCAGTRFRKRKKKNPTKKISLSLPTTTVRKEPFVAQYKIAAAMISIT